MRDRKKILYMYPGRIRLFHWKFFLLFFVFIKLTCLVQFAASNRVELKIIADPQEIQLTANRESKVYVFIQNLSPIEVSGIQLSVFDTMDLDISVAPSKSRTLPPNGMGVWTLELTNKKTAQALGTVYFGVSCLAEANAGSKKTTFTFYSNFKIVNKIQSSVEDAIEVNIEVPEDTLFELREKYHSYIIIKNTFSLPVEITGYSFIGPAFLKSRVLESLKGKKIEPGISYTFPFELELADRFTPGSHLSRLDLRFKWSELGHEKKSNKIVSFKLKTGVLGESEVLTAFGIPSLLLLPGFVVMVVLGLYWRHFPPRQKIVEIKTPEFWVFAICFSIIIAFLYPIITGIFWQHRDYIQSYGLKDVLFVWGLSVVFFPPIFYFFGRGIRNVYRYFYVISGDNSPLEILNKLRRKKIGLFLKRVEIEIDELIENGYLIEEAWPAKDKVLVGGKILLEWNKKNMDNSLRRDIERDLIEGGDFKNLLTLLKKGKVSKQLKLVWPNKIKIFEIDKDKVKIKKKYENNTDLIIEINGD